MGLELVVPGHAIATLRRALLCLTRFGEDVDISAGSHAVRLSSVNASRSAFAAISFERGFFTKLSVHNFAHPGRSLRYCVNAKALYAAHKPKQAESIAWSVSDTDASATLSVDASNECRLVVQLNCQHGVVKTYRLTYGGSDALVCRPDRIQHYSTWCASGKQLKEMVDHFHTRGTGGNEEITFYSRPELCSMRSFRDPIGGETRPGEPPHLSTELTLEPDAFDSYSVNGNRTVSFALKEFKAIVTFADGTSSRLTSHFLDGGTPIIFDFDGDSFSAEFVIATDDYDDAAGAHAADIKKERSVPAASAAQGMRQSTLPPLVRHQAPPRGATPLFRPPSPSQQRASTSAAASQAQTNGRRASASDDEFGDMLGDEDDFDEETYGELERMSQMPMSQRGTAARRQASVPVAGPSKTANGAGDDVSFEIGDSQDATPHTKKRPAWQLLDDDDEDDEDDEDD